MALPSRGGKSIKVFFIYLLTYFDSEITMPSN